MKNPTSLTHGRLDSAVLRAAISALFVIALAVMPLPVNAQNRYSLKLQNDSKWDIYSLYVSSSETQQWGPDQLGDDTLAAGSSFTLTDLIPGEYDIKFVDEDGDECTLRNIKIFKNESWLLTTPWLARCEGYS